MPTLRNAPGNSGSGSNFHDGTVLTAADAAASLARSNPTWKFSAVDRQTLSVEAPYPVQHMPEMLALPRYAIVKRQTDSAGTAVLIGTGLFIMAVARHTTRRIGPGAVAAVFIAAFVGLVVAVDVGWERVARRHSACGDRFNVWAILVAIARLFGPAQRLRFDEISDEDAWAGKIVQYTSDLQP